MALGSLCFVATGVTLGHALQWLAAPARLTAVPRLHSVGPRGKAS
jgi:hypothetical protein